MIRLVRLSSKVVAITGASAGIGRATAVQLAAQGAAVVVSARRTDRLDELVTEIRAAGGRALAVPADVARAEDVQNIVAQAVSTFGRLDVMICNAGIGFHGTLEETSIEAMRRLVDVNLMGTLYAARAAMDIFKRQNSGHIIAVSSIAGRRGIGGSSLYSATKAAQIGFIEALRAEFYGTPIKASVVLPVSTATEFLPAIARDFGHEINALGPRQSAEAVAKAIVRCVITPRPEVYPFSKARVLALVSVLAPGQADRAVRKYTRRRVVKRHDHSS